MDLKEILKPDWNKIIVFILLFPFLSFIQSFFYVSGVEVIIFRVIGFVIHPFLDIFHPLLPTQITNVGYVSPYNFFFLVVGILNSFYQYVLSSLIVWIIYKKFQKMKKNPRIR
jgi:hypothetical protein